MFASELHLKPWEIELLTYEQLLGAVESFKQQQAETQKLKDKLK